MILPLTYYKLRKIAIFKYFFKSASKYLYMPIVNIHVPVV